MILVTTYTDSLKLFLNSNISKQLYYLNSNSLIKQTKIGKTMINQKCIK